MYKFGGLYLYDIIGADNMSKAMVMQNPEGRI